MNVYHSPLLSSPALTHAFFGRKGGVSAGVYASLNTSFQSADSRDCLIENRGIVSRHLGIPFHALNTPWQVHSPDCVVVDDPSADPATIKADALATDRPGILIGVQTADCGPVLFAGQKADGRPVIGAAHAGWGGALKGVLENTIAEMVRLGAMKETIRAALGPCIGPESYEVSDGFEAPFLAHHLSSARFFKAAKRPGHSMFDLPAYILWRLSAARIGEFEYCGHDTCAEADDYFSFRRATLNGEKDYGRQVSAIMIAE